jgi:PAS domain S-box-containing protein
LVPHSAPRGHFVRFYDDEAFFLSEVAEFVDTALRSGGVGIVIATPQHVQRLQSRLAGFGAAARDPWYPGELIVLDARETLDQFIVEGWPDERRFNEVVGTVVESACAGGRTLHAFGEMVALLCADARYEAAVQLEALWNRLAQRVTFSLFCAYPKSLFPDAEHERHFRHVCEAHQHVRPSEVLCDLGDAADAERVVALWEQKAHALEVEVERRRQAERTLRRREVELVDFVENAAEGLHRVGADGTILWANRAELEMLGYARDEYVGHHVSEFHVDPAVVESMLARLACGETLRDQPAALRCKDGSIRHVLIHSNACFEDGKLQYTRCFTRDASERQALARAHVERERLLVDLQQANRAKDEFLAMLGHELRNPLSPIVTALQLMRMRGDTGTSREQGIIQRQVDHLVCLVDDLLDVSRVTRGKIELKKEWIAIADVLTKAVEMASLLLEQRRHRLVVDVQGPLRWKGDPVRLSQVVANLLTNAARYTDVGGEIRLRAGVLCDGGIEIAVKDNGIGIPTEMLPRVFDLFFQGGRGIDRAEGGLGIGLALVKSLVGLHGGTVTAVSEGRGRGSEFVIRLPRADDSDPADAGAAPGERGQADAPVDSRRVLLVDDNVDGADMLARLLQSSGHRVEVAYDPVTALELAAAFGPEVAILDIGLPVMDGYDLAIRLRERLKDCRFIALTGYGQDADRGRSRAAGFERHLVKPVEPKAVVEAVNARDA